MGKWRIKWKNDWKTTGLFLLAVTLALPLGKGGATLGRQVFEAVYETVNETQTVSRDVYEELTVAEDDTVLENKIANDLANARSHKFQEQVVYGNWFAFVDADTRELYTYHLGNRELQVVSDSPANKTDLDLYRGYLVWEEEGDIRVYHFKEKHTAKITDTPGVYESYPAIYGKRVVYRGEGDDIYLYDMDTGQVSNLSQNPGVWRTKPGIWKDIVAWTDNSDGYPNVYIYDLKKGARQKITDYTSEKWVDYPVVARDWVVYPFVDDNGVRQLMAYDLKRGNSHLLADPKSGKFRIRVDKFDGGTLIWNRTDNQVALYNLDQDKLTELEVMDYPAIYGNQVFGIENGDNRKVKVRKHEETGNVRNNKGN